VKRLAKLKTYESKLAKNQGKYEALRKQTIIAKTARHKRDGTYRPGMNMDDPLGDLLKAAATPYEDEDGEKKKPAAQKRKKDPNEVCEYCGAKGHLTKRSKSCTAAIDSRKKYKRDGSGLLVEPTPDIASLLAAAATPIRTAAATMPARLPEESYNSDEENATAFMPMMNDEAADTCQMDELPFDTVDLDSSDDEDDHDLFHDAGTWDSDANNSEVDDLLPVGKI
jgi:hypothetical protein